MGPQEKGNFTERAVNKFIELVLSRLVNAERLQVRIKSNLKKLGRGELDALTIQMFNFLLQPNLRVSEFRLEIGPSAVNTKSIVQRKIELLHPSAGQLRIAIAPEQLTAALNSELADFSKENQSNILFKEVVCELRIDGEITLHFQWADNGESRTGSYILNPQIEIDRNVVILLDRGFIDREPPTELVELAIAKISKILSLTDLANQGTTFKIQQIDMTASQIIVQAHAEIEQFPSA